MRDFVPPIKTGPYANTDKYGPDFLEKLEKVKKVLGDKKIFLSEAHIKEVGKGVYQAFKRTVIEEIDPKTNQPVQEVITLPGIANEIKWGGELCEGRSGDPIVAQTFVDKKVVYLTPLDKNVRKELKNKFPCIP